MLFRPGLFRRWLDCDPGELAGRRLPAEQVLGPTVLELERAVFAEPDSGRRAALVDAFWMERVKMPGPPSLSGTVPARSESGLPAPAGTLTDRSGCTSLTAGLPAPAGTLFDRSGCTSLAAGLPSALSPDLVPALPIPTASVSTDPDASAQLVDRIVTGIQLDRGQRSVEDVAARWGLSSRSLQRLFRTYVGMPPKAVIRRYRLHETMGLASGDPDWAALALELGYFDQAHLIRDFKAVVGMTPGSYAKRIIEEET
ncbi:AraC family transcriptional regulator [Paenibacillus albicereus]|uniref:AraC family transcriptional regulator n=2 Tax=Paenibacillus albicereus TaxID=2726185 RepID=A0A6H2H547_9BACL|nr:AraC family transcriptional regulator [Paenibacillus albicereus]